VLDTYSQKDLDGRAQHLDVLVVQKTPGHGDDMVVIWGHARVQHWCYQATRTVLHPPRTMEGRVESHEKVPVLKIHQERPKSQYNVTKYGVIFRLPKWLQSLDYPSWNFQNV